MTIKYGDHVRIKPSEDEPEQLGRALGPAGNGAGLLEDRQVVMVQLDDGYYDLNDQDMFDDGLREVPVELLEVIK